LKYFCLLLAALVMTGCALQPNSSSGDSEARHRAKLRTELGSGYFSQGKMEIALQEFNEAARIDGSYAPAYLGLALVRAALGQDEMAEANFKKTLQLDPESSEAHNNYGTFLCSRGHFDESIIEFKEALKNPLYATPELAYLNAGVCSLKKNDTSNAEIYLNKALKLRPSLRQASFELANLYFERGDMLQARTHLGRAMRDIDAPPEMLWLGVRIERVLGDKDAEASYSLLLRHKYPDSEQTKALLAE
jgi:type IV pilus assembly protein PilF